MFNSRITSIVAGIVFLVIALCGLYRLIHFFPISIAGVPVHQIPSFFVFAIFTALSIVAFQGARRRE